VLLARRSSAGGESGDLFQAVVAERSRAYLDRRSDDSDLAEDPVDAPTDLLLGKFVLLKRRAGEVEPVRNRGGSVGENRTLAE